MNVFDIIGPVMIGPSSSHTAGAVRIGKTASLLLGAPAKKAQIFLHGSFAKTYRGHGTDKALAGGILGMEPWDPGIRTSLELAKDKGLDIEFFTADLGNVHPNTARIILADKNGRELCIQGASVGGGNILITHVNNMEVNFTGQNNTLLIFHQDVPGTIAKVTALVAGSNGNICRFYLSRVEKGGAAIMTIELDTAPDEVLLDEIQKQPYVQQAIFLKRSYKDEAVI